MNAYPMKRGSTLVAAIFALVALLFVFHSNEAFASSGSSVPSITNVKGDYDLILRESTPRSDGAFASSTIYRTCTYNRL